MGRGSSHLFFPRPTTERCGDEKDRSTVGPDGPSGAASQRGGARYGGRLLSRITLAWASGLVLPIVSAFLIGDGLEAEVLSETENGEWIRVRYLEGNDSLFGGNATFSRAPTGTEPCLFRHPGRPSAIGVEPDVDNRCRIMAGWSTGSVMYESSP
jgi:hypothetical protein